MGEPSLALSTCHCGQIARQDYSKYKILKPVIDGHHSGYYSDALKDKEGKPFPRDPKNKTKRIVPNNYAFHEAIKRTEGAREETG